MRAATGLARTALLLCPTHHTTNSSSGNEAPPPRGGVTAASVVSAATVNLHRIAELVAELASDAAATAPELGSTPASPSPSSSSSSPQLTHGQDEAPARRARIQRPLSPHRFTPRVCDVPHLSSPSAQPTNDSNNSSNTIGNSGSGGGNATPTSRLVASLVKEAIGDPMTGETRATPAFQCPLCFAAHLQESGGGEGGDINTNTTAPSPSLSSSSSSARHHAWHTPHSLYTHLPWCHGHQGICPREFQPYNDYAMDWLVARILGVDPTTTTTTTTVTATTSPSQPSSSVAAAAASSPSLSSSSPPPPLPSPIELIILVDVANIVLDAGWSIVTLPGSAGGSDFFSQVPAAVVLIHEIFIPHTALDLEALFELTLLHAASEFVPLYAVSALESGDVASAQTVAQLFERVDARVAGMGMRHNGHSTQGATTSTTDNSNSSSSSCSSSMGRHSPPSGGVHPTARLCPPVVLLTKDNHQRACMVDMFPGRLFTAATGGLSRDSIIETCRRALIQGRR